MFGYNCFGNQSAIHCTAAACTSALITDNADTAGDLVVSVFAAVLQSFHTVTENSV